MFLTGAFDEVGGDVSGVRLIVAISLLVLEKIWRGLAAVGSWLMNFGALGLFGISLLDSALVPLPSGPDLVMITLTALNPGRMPFYALAATIGSTIGCTLLYLAARRAGSAALSRVSQDRRNRIENVLGRYDVLAVGVTAILPPPFPFKAFVLSAGVFKLRLGRFIAAIFAGRAVRFLVEGWLAIQFGDDALRLIRANAVKVLAGVALILAAVIAVRVWRARGRRAGVLAGDDVGRQG